MPLSKVKPRGPRSKQQCSPRHAHERSACERGGQEMSHWKRVRGVMGQRRVRERVWWCNLAALRPDNT